AKLRILAKTPGFFRILEASSRNVTSREWWDVFSIPQCWRTAAAAVLAARGGLEVLDRTLDPDDGGDMRRPFRFSDGGLGFEYGDGSGFVAVTPVLVDAP